MKLCLLWNLVQLLLLHGVVAPRVGHQTCNQQVVGVTPSLPIGPQLRNSYGWVVHTLVPSHQAV